MREQDPNLLAAIGRVGKPVNESVEAQAKIHNILREYHLHNTIAAAAEELGYHDLADESWQKASQAHGHAHALHKEHVGDAKSFTEMKRTAAAEATKTIADKLS